VRKRYTDWLTMKVVQLRVRRQQRPLGGGADDTLVVELPGHGAPPTRQPLGLPEEIERVMPRSASPPILVLVGAWW
jgi:hypothetical protein